MVQPHSPGAQLPAEGRGQGAKAVSDRTSPSSNEINHFSEQQASLPPRIKGRLKGMFANRPLSPSAIPNTYQLTTFSRVMLGMPSIQEVFLSERIPVKTIKRLTRCRIQRSFCFYPVCWPLEDCLWHKSIFETSTSSFWPLCSTGWTGLQCLRSTMQQQEAGQMFRQTALSLLTKESQIPAGFLLKFQEVVMFYPSTKYVFEDFICLPTCFA